MRIISQNGIFDFPYESCILRIHKTEIEAFISLTPDFHYTFAVYSTRGIVERAMQLLHEVYIVHENFKKIDTELQLKMLGAVEKEIGLKYGGVFQFPKE